MKNNAPDIVAMIEKARAEYLKNAPSVYSTLDNTTKALCSVFNVKTN